MDFGEHDAAQIDIILAGHRAEGFAPDSVITIAPNADHRSTKVGADGLVVSSKMNDETAEVTLTLLKTSATHRYLKALYRIDRSTPGGAGVGAFFMRDRLTGEEDSSEVFWIKRRPDRKIEAEASEVEWKLTLGKWVEKDEA